MELKQLSEKLQQQQDIIKVAGGINSATDKAVALQKEIKRCVHLLTIPTFTVLTRQALAGRVYCVGVVLGPAKS